MVVKRKFIVVRGIVKEWTPTGWTDQDMGTTLPVGKKKALEALAKARRTYPEEAYKLKEVKQK